MAVTIDAEAVKAFTAANNEKDAVTATRKAVAKQTIAAVRLALLATPSTSCPAYPALHLALPAAQIEQFKKIQLLNLIIRIIKEEGSN